MNETYQADELTYEPIDETGTPIQKRTPQMGRKVMAILVRQFCTIAGIELKGNFDASSWLKPLGRIYRYFGKDLDKTIAFMERAAGYFKGKNLNYNVHTLDKNLPLIEAWAEQAGKKDISERRKL